MPNPIPPQVSLRALREWRGLTLEQLADEIRAQGHNVSVTALNNAELGHRQASPLLLDAWARALGIRSTHIRQGRDLRQWVDAIDRSADGADLVEVA
ncbi:helix-turn-helix domain-containing protein [Micromonospora chersina]|uniref:helix-turn-helix domain-containing protein n=1 Tax=Micromonospora chersina TaxID=47854 RepID=UPI00371AA0EB